MAASPILTRTRFALAVAGIGCLSAAGLAFNGDPESAGAMALIAGVLTLGVLVWLERGPHRRLLDLRLTMNSFASGGTSSIPTQGKDEFGDMGRAFEYLVNALHNREARLADQLSFQRTLLDTIPNPVYFTDLDGRFLGCNLAFEPVIGRSRETVAGHLFGDLVDPETARIHDDALAKLKSEDGLLVFESSMTFANGDERHVLYLKDLFRQGDGQTAGCVGALVDITDRKTMEEELRTMATTDALTGASNRRHFFDLGEEALLRAHRYGNPMSVLMIDADKFKSVNDTHGHDVGDLVLKKLAKICRDHARATDIFGRLGGEEFAFVLTETEVDGAVEFAERLRQDLASQRIPLEGSVDELSFTVSIGAVQFRDESDDTLEDILKRADHALYAAKESGRNRVVKG